MFGMYYNLKRIVCIVYMLLVIKDFFYLRAISMVSGCQPANSRVAKEVNLHIYSYPEVFANT